MSEPRRGMGELGRLLRYSRPYTGVLLLSVILMAIVGAAQAFTALLIGPVFDRVLNPASADVPVVLFTIPLLKRPLYLSQIVPGSIHNVWTLVAISILFIFFIKGICDYAGNYLINYVGFSAVTDLRQRVFDRVLHQDAHFFESNSTGRVMSSIMNDLEKIQVAMSDILADLLRQTFTALGLLTVVLQTDWKLALVSLTVLPFVLVPTLRLGRRLRRTTRRAQDDAAEVNQVLQETLSGNQVVKSFGAEEIESNRFRDRIQRLRRSNLRYVAQQAVASPLIEFFGALTIVGLVTYARLQIKAGEVTAGEIVALVGPSGAGKTTLANLVPRFYDVTGGAVRIDGRDLRDLRLSSIREKIGIVAQDTFLFNDTVANNIGYGRPDATREQIHAAARNALAEEFILRMPEGYDTMIGERGQKLSGGQRQRLAIARALLKDAPILILDEATSHLDTESERLVQTALQNLMEHRTVIVIAHRLSTVRRADKIVVLDQGRIAGTRKHDELLARGGIYRRRLLKEFLELAP